MVFDKLQEVNMHIRITEISDESFKQYGRIIHHIDFKDLTRFMEEKTVIPAEGNIYLPSVAEMESFPVKDCLDGFFGEMPFQVGYCNGMNSSLNAFEYHKSSEIDVAVTDLVLLLGKVQDISEGRYDSHCAQAFYLPKGVAVELYATTLHFSPCRVFRDGFKCIVILPRLTNLPLDKHKKREKEVNLLFAKNKWLLIHPSRTVLAEKGAHIGIYGNNTEILTI